MGVVTFNGVSTETLGLIVQFIPSYEYPEREYQSINVPGRNGDLILDKGSYRNIERSYSFAKVFNNNETFVNQANKIVSWLNSAKGYARLQDSYEPLYYRMALYKSEGSMSNFYDTATVLDVTFDCKPQRWLIEGDTPIAVTNGSTIPEKTSYDANPEITMTVAANTTATLGISSTGYTCSISVGPFTENTTVTIDCENKECYSGNTLYNSKLTLTNGKFPVLPGSAVSTVSISNATNVTIKPRWWTL